MNHKWNKISDKIAICKTCGCKRSKHYISGQKIYSYNRSSISFFDSRPDCIDWEEENKKTID